MPCAGVHAAQSREPLESDSPLSPGTRWTYQGRVRWAKAGSAEVTERTVTWEMEVLDTIKRRHLLAALLKGHPGDLAWYEESTRRADYLVLRVGTSRFYLMRDQQRDVVLNRLRDEGDALVDLVKDASLFLDLPLWPGKSFGDPDQLTRQDGLYQQHRFSLRTLPDHQSVDFVPGIGITRYIYAHHGTVSEADVQLVAFRPGRRSP